MTYRADVHFLGAGGTQFSGVVGIMEHQSGGIVSTDNSRKACTAILTMGRYSRYALHQASQPGG